MQYPFTFKYEDQRMICELQFNSYVTVIEGDSATGRTYICSRIRATVNEKSTRQFIKCNINLDNLGVCLNEHEVESIYNKHNSVIFLDRVDMYLSHKLENFIKYNPNNNIFVLMYRGSESTITISINDMYRLTSEKRGNKNYFKSEHLL